MSQWFSVWVLWVFIFFPSLGLKCFVFSLISLHFKIKPIKSNDVGVYCCCCWVWELIIGGKERS
ncbi:hypothetical protein I3843_11G015000 [Carya illinoinensis]|uniref:Uncharacterized protein n=1 Tax=Carya illinoinensis TaxID=32201 RepID=A0A922DLA7_CARIL|nr:hypothetical protein I3842_11G015200 [Carya illinoinensis]KAG7954399.1 hypothetical protein I3843_11G015000 [Carya illinoinensis]